MNIKRLEKLRDFIREGKNPNIGPNKKLGFNMGWFCSKKTGANIMKDTTKHDCRTVGCIAGWTVAIFGTCEQKQEVLLTEDAARLFAQDILDLDYLTADKLFMPTGVQKVWSKITPKQAARVIDKLIKTGSVDWSSADKKSRAKTSSMEEQ